MAWANQYVLGKLGELKVDDWKLKLTHDDWSNQELANHIVLAAGRYAEGTSGIWVYSKLSQEMVIPVEKLKEYCAVAHEILRVQSHRSDEVNIVVD